MCHCGDSDPENGISVVQVDVTIIQWLVNVLLPYNLKHLVYFSQIIYQDVWVVILVVKIPIFCQDVAVVIYDIKLVIIVKGDPKVPFSLEKSATPFPGLLHFTFDLFFIMLSVKQGGIKYHFLSLWYDSIWDWTLVSSASGEHSSY